MVDDEYTKRETQELTESTADVTLCICHALYTVMVNVRQGRFHIHRDSKGKGENTQTMCYMQVK